MNDQLAQSQRLLIGHGALVLLVGFIAGFGFLFFLLGRVELWPFGVIEYPIPGTYDAWRMAHTEGIMNGFGLWILSAILPSLSHYVVNLYRLSIAMVIVAWTIVIASCLDPIFPSARGLAFTETSNLTSNIAFFLFYIGIVIAFWVVISIAINAFKTNTE